MSSQQSIHRESDGSYQWSCPIDIDYHRRQAKTTLWVSLFVAFVMLAIGLGAVVINHDWDSLWAVFPVPAVILVISVPLVCMMWSADSPMEQYVLTEKYVKTGYGKGAVFCEFTRTESVVFTQKYIEMSGKYKTQRIYVPEQDMVFVRDYIWNRVPAGTTIRNQQPC